MKLTNKVWNTDLLYGGGHYLSGRALPCHEKRFLRYISTTSDSRIRRAAPMERTQSIIFICHRHSRRRRRRRRYDC